MEIDTKSNAYKLLTEERKAQKYALMCFFYNQKHLGRTGRWKRLYEEKFGISPTNVDYALLSKFSVLYSQFMEHVFPKLTKQLDLLNEASISFLGLTFAQRVLQELGWPWGAQEPADTFDHCPPRTGRTRCPKQTLKL